MHRSFVALSSESLTSAFSTPQSPCRDENWKNWKRHYKILETCLTISSYLILSLLLQESQNWMSLPGQDLCIFLDPHVASPTAASNDLKSVCCGQSFSVQPVYVNTTSLSIICLKLQLAKECQSKNQNATCSTPMILSNCIMAVQYWQYSWFQKTRFRLPFIYYLC